MRSLLIRRKMDSRPIGVFDSGIGGISLMRNMIRLLPGEDFIYYGDEKHAPYGTKSEEEILALSLNVVDFLLKHDVKAIVIACNTATSAAAKPLRSSLSLPIIGIEPALKPAQLERKNGGIAVLATPATLRQNKFLSLMKLYGEGAIPVPCPGLMEFVERGITEGEELDAFLNKTLEPLKEIELDGAVLGCTHYSFLARAIGKALRGVRLYDGNEGTARQLKRVLEEKRLLSVKQKGTVSLYTSSDSSAAIALMQTLLLKPIEL